MKRLFLTLAALIVGATTNAQDRPNIVWIIVDDMSADFSCYGETLIETPAVDGLAKRGTLFTNAYVTAPVCSTCRSALITGMYQTSIGAHHHRSGQGSIKIHLPEGVRPIPAILQEAGYHTSISGSPNTFEKKFKQKRFGKTDYNFEWDQAIYDDNTWRTREDGQPFFHQFQLSGGKKRGQSQITIERLAQQAELEFGSRTKATDVVLPPYYPDAPVQRHDWAAYLDTVRFTDQEVAQILQLLKEDQVLENTFIVFMTDHGISHARGKQFNYDEGLHVPLVIAGPTVESGSVRDDLVEHIDLAALSLCLAEVPLPASMQAQDILASNYQAREAVFAARDRCDETEDRIRSVRTQRFKYIRNGMPKRPHLQPCAYKDSKAIYEELRALHQAGRLKKLQERILFSPERSPEELYDLQKDPFELDNLAKKPGHQKTLLAMRKRLDDWILETGDMGQQRESEEQFNASMELYEENLNRPHIAPAHRQVVLDNIKLMRQWREEGK